MSEETGIKSSVQEHWRPTISRNEHDVQQVIKTWAERLGVMTGHEAGLRDVGEGKRQK